MSSGLVRGWREIVRVLVSTMNEVIIYGALRRSCGFDEREYGILLSSCIM